MRSDHLSKHIKTHELKRCAKLTEADDTSDVTSTTSGGEQITDRKSPCFTDTNNNIDADMSYSDSDSEDSECEDIDVECS